MFTFVKQRSWQLLTPIIGWKHNCVGVSCDGSDVGGGDAVALCGDGGGDSSDGGSGVIGDPDCDGDAAPQSLSLLSGSQV